MKHLIGVVSFGNQPFLELAIRGIKETLTRAADLIVIVAKPNDTAMQEYLCAQGVNLIQNADNNGFASSVNDIFEHAFVKHDYDTVTIMGNDVIPYPGALDGMIECAETTDYEWICATQFDSKTLVAMYPEAAHYFQGSNMVYSDFSARPWEMHKDLSVPAVEPDAMKDVRNLAMFKRSVFEKIGYCDVNYWPNAYYEDNDAVRRALRADVKACGLPHCVYFHFWSRTIHQGEQRQHGRYFRDNESYYISKWGGMPNQETKNPPIKIPDRMREQEFIRQWRGH